MSDTVEEVRERSPLHETASNAWPATEGDSSRDRFRIRVRRAHGRREVSK